MSDRPGEDDDVEKAKSGKNASPQYDHLRPESEEDAGGSQNENVATTDEAENDSNNTTDSDQVEHLRPGETSETTEAPENAEPKRPGSGGIPDAETLSKAGEEPDETDKGHKLTRAGRAFQKHGNRSDIWGKPEGNPEAMNATGQKTLDSIIDSPDTKWQTRHTGRFGDVVEGKQPDGRGGRWSADGEKFHGFLDP